MMKHSMLVTTFDPFANENGAIRRVWSLIGQLGVRRVVVLAFFKSESVVVDGLTVSYLPIKWSDLPLVFKLFFKGYPLSNVIYQRLAVRQIKGVELACFHLVRSVQLNMCEKASLSIDFCESVADNLMRRVDGKSRLLDSMRRMESRRLSKLELRLGQSCASAYFITSNDSLFAKVRNPVVLKNIARMSDRLVLDASVRNRGAIGFLGDLSYSPNVDSLQIIASSIFDTPYVCEVVGNDKSLRSLPTGNFRYHGFVEKPSEILAQCLAGVFISQRSTGLQNKILDYLSYGLPVITCKEVAQSFHGTVPFLVLNDDFDLIDAIEYLLSLSEAEYNVLVESGLTYLQDNYS